MTPADIAWKKWRGTIPQSGTQEAFHAGFAAATEECAKVAEQEIETYNEGVSAIDVRMSFTTGPKWKDGPAIARVLRALKTPQAGEVEE